MVSDQLGYPRPNAASEADRAKRTLEETLIVCRKWPRPRSRMAENRLKRLSLRQLSRDRSLSAAGSDNDPIEGSTHHIARDASGFGSGRRLSEDTDAFGETARIPIHAGFVHAITANVEAIYPRPRK